MATTLTQDRDFISDVVSTTLLEDSIKWIAFNLDPDKVFSKEKLEEWAEENGFVRE